VNDGHSPRITTSLHLNVSIVNKNIFKALIIEVSVLPSSNRMVEEEKTLPLARYRSTSKKLNLQAFFC
jgi:hypothetical protein